MGRDAGSEIIATNATGSATYGIDALWSIDRTLAPGAHLTFRAVLGYRPSGCDDDVTTTIPHFPTVHVRTYGHDGSVGADHSLRYLGDEAPGCKGS